MTRTSSEPNTGTCSGHVPGYITTYEQFKEKGIDNVYVVAVNDAFVLKSVSTCLTQGVFFERCYRAWKNQLAPNGTKVRFIVV